MTTQGWNPTAGWDAAAGTVDGISGPITLVAGSNVTITDNSPSAGDITIAATGGGASPLTTKGDLYGHSTVDARIPVGSDGQVLTADSAQALGVKWATAGGVSSLDTIAGAVTLVAGSNVTITDNSPSAGQITIAATGGGSTASWSVLTNGDATAPELIFASGDVIMTETP